jgi:hypothetical protein
VALRCLKTFSTDGRNEGLAISIGDVHGCSTALAAVVRAIDLTALDTLVFLGDYIDRGTPQKSGEVLDLGYLKCIDTFCHGGGWITALAVGTGKVGQANLMGEMR